MLQLNELETMDLGFAPEFSFTEDGLADLIEIAGSGDVQQILKQGPENGFKFTLELPPTPPKDEGSLSDRWLDDASDLKPFLEMDSVSEVPATPESCDETQNLIDEMEDFLSHHEKSFASPLANSTFSEASSAAPSPMSDDFMEEEKKVDADTLAAEQILDALMKGNVSSDSGYAEGLSDYSAISQIVTEDGRNVLIVIAPPSPQGSNPESPSPIGDESLQVPSVATASLPSPSSVSSGMSPMSYQEESSDTDWTPESPAPSRTSKKTSGRKPYDRPTVAPQRGKRKSYAIKDKKERKKLQNVEAARRYRDKKKLEQMGIEGEEQQLLDKNKKLKDQLSDIENEVKTLKKLMTELGLVKLI